MKFQKLMFGLSIVGLTITSVSATQAASQKGGESRVEPTVMIAQRSPQPRRIQFARGESSATVSGAVVRGTQDTYLLSARKGQEMAVTISSEEENAVFNIINPKGKIIAQESTVEGLVLDTSGTYKIVVSGTRGNATYTLNVAVAN